ncbi:AGC/AKT protein kinase- variant [Apiospora marii]|uniref:AGC/AKT protein kinase- variant n=1 Tax=Apiospora marii TaxID=335849 RepID=A0ABR1R2Q5_9PEZI
MAGPGRAIEAIEYSAWPGHIWSSFPVTDYMSGGELFWHLQKEGRFDEKRAKFYCRADLGYTTSSSQRHCVPRSQAREYLGRHKKDQDKALKQAESTDRQGSVPDQVFTF